MRDRDDKDNIKRQSYIDRVSRCSSPFDSLVHPEDLRESMFSAINIKRMRNWEPNFGISILILKIAKLSSQFLIILILAAENTLSPWFKWWKSCGQLTGCCWKEGKKEEWKFEVLWSYVVEQFTLKYLICWHWFHQTRFFLECKKHFFNPFL